MLLNKKRKERPKKPDWFPDKVYLHFDGPVKRAVAESVVKNVDEVNAHHFLPLMAFEKRQRRFRRRKNKPPEVSVKIRQLAYPSNMDACIFAYYAHLLDKPYERLIKAVGIDECVIGYRKIGSNIDLALSAFSEVRSRGSCVAFAFDISGFFDNIDHGTLRRNWCRVLGTASLPPGHDKVFQNLTRFSTVNRQSCLARLGYKRTCKDRDIKARPICSIKEYRQIIKGRNKVGPSLVEPWEKSYRIPQGTPISAIAANISMIDFDIKMQNAMSRLGGSYRRYSDDILVVVPTTARNAIQDILHTNLKHYTRRLKINDKKTDIIEFIPGALANGRGSKALQYLGFLFDGERHLLRPGTISKFYRRMHQAVHHAQRQHSKAASGTLDGRNVLHKRSILVGTTHLGVKNFVTSYAAKAGDKLGKKVIKKQISRHMSIYRKLTSK